MRRSGSPGSEDQEGGADSDTEIPDPQLDAARDINRSFDATWDREPAYGDADSGVFTPRALRSAALAAITAAHSAVGSAPGAVEARRALIDSGGLDCAAVLSYYDVGDLDAQTYDRRSVVRYGDILYRRTNESEDEAERGLYGGFS